MVSNRLADGDILYAANVNDSTGMILVEAGENISAGNVVYIHLTNGKAYVSGIGTADDIRANGIAMNGVSTGSDVQIITRGVFTTTGLTDKLQYYLGAAGALSTDLSAVCIGTALSTTELYIQIVQDDRDRIGTVKSVAISLTGMPSNMISAFWKACTGGTLSDTESPLNGATLPNLNSVKSFLRGSATSGTTGGADTYNLAHTHTVTANGFRADQVDGNTGFDFHCSATLTSSTTGSTTQSILPVYYEVVFFVKVK